MLYPAALPAVALLVGVVCGWRHPTLGSGVVALLAVIAWLATTLVVGRRSRPCVVLPTVALSFLVVGVLLGGQATSGATASSLGLWYERYRSERVGPSPVVVEGYLTRDARPTDYGATLSLDVETIFSPTGPQAVSGERG